MRAPRRPATWVPAGPRPSGPGEDPDLWPARGEDLCHLSGDFRILQRVDGHRWSLDDLVTAWFASESAVRPPARFADIGCGIGSVLMLLAWRFPSARGIGVEAQPGSASLARRSLRWNGIESRCEVRLGDLRDPTMLPEGDVFDLVTGTPPYFVPGEAWASPDAQRLACRFELRGGTDDYCRAASRLLAPQGRFVVCTRDDRARVALAAREVGLALERSCSVVPREGRPELFSVHVLARVSEAATLCEDAPLVVRDAAGRWADEFRSVRATMGMPTDPPARGTARG